MITMLVQLIVAILLLDVLMWKMLLVMIIMLVKLLDVTLKKVVFMKIILIDVTTMINASIIAAMTKLDVLVPL
jgi:uncharacterized membrane protein